MEISRKKLIAIIGVALIAVIGISAYSSTISWVPCVIKMRADPAIDITIGQFQDCMCTIPFTSYDWDGVVEGEFYQCPVYVKNTGTVGLYVTYLPTDLWFYDNQAHFIVTAYVLEFGGPCQLYLVEPPCQLPEKATGNPTGGFYLPPGKVIKVDIVLYIDMVVVGKTYDWEFTFWGCYP